MAFNYILELYRLLDRNPEDKDTLEQIKNIYEKNGERDKAKEVENRLRKLIEKEEFESNLVKAITLTHFEVHQLDFFGNLNWRFQPQVNVLLGKNGYGKTHLLRLLTALIQKDSDRISEFFIDSKSTPYVELEVNRDDECKTIRRNQIVFEESIGKIPLLAIPDQRFINKSNTTINPSNDDKTNLREHGAFHFLYQKPYDGLIQNFLYQMAITYLNDNKEFKSEIFNLIHNVFDKLTDKQIRIEKIEPTGNAGFVIDVITEGNSKPVPIQFASQGTLSVLAIFGLIFNYLKSLFPTLPESKLREQKAIVLIDEIDAHLHPSWQQRIIGLLRSNFPNIQFIVTAHSPLVIAGCRNGEVAVLRKSNSGFVIEQYGRDFIGYTAKELYEKIFEIEDRDYDFLYYNALYAFKDNLETQIEKLRQKKNSLSMEDEKKLVQLIDDLYYASQAKDAFDKRHEDSMLKLEIKELKAKLDKMEKETHKKKGGSKGGIHGIK